MTLTPAVKQAPFPLRRRSLRGGASQDPDVRHPTRGCCCCRRTAHAPERFVWPLASSQAGVLGAPTEHALPEDTRRTRSPHCRAVLPSDRTSAHGLPVRLRATAITGHRRRRPHTQSFSHRCVNSARSRNPDVVLRARLRCATARVPPRSRPRHVSRGVRPPPQTGWTAAFASRRGDDHGNVAPGATRCGLLCWTR